MQATVAYQHMAGEDCASYLESGYCHALGIPFEGETFACDDVRAGPHALAPHRRHAVVTENRVCLRW